MKPHIPHQKEVMVPVISKLSESEVSIMLLYQLCLTPYTAMRIKNCLISTFVIEVATMKNADDFHYAKESIMCC